MSTSDRGNRSFEDDQARDPGRDWTGGGRGNPARQVWLAGVGAWSRAQAEGSRLFDSLVRDGMEAERASPRTAGVRDAVDRGAEDVRGFATHTWDRLGQVVEETVQRSLLRLGLPRRDELEALERRVDALATALEEARAAAPGAASPAATARKRNPASRKPPA